MAERIQKVLAAAGLGSRRYLDGLLQAGQIRVNGKAARPGERIDPAAQVCIGRRRVRLRPAATAAVRPVPKVLAYYKPEGELCTASDPRGRRTVFAALPALRRERWVSVGRLDINSRGLLLFTNDGELAHRLMHPRNEVEREYAVRVSGRAAPAQLEALRRGVRLHDGLARFLTIVDGGGAGRNHWYRVTLAEGRNREVRRLWASQGLQVSRLIRIRYGPCRLPPGRRPGQSWRLERREVTALARAAGWNL